MKKYLLNWMTIILVAIVSAGFASCGDDDNVISNNYQENTTDVKEAGDVLIVSVKNAGTFESLIGPVRKFSFRKLKVSGPLNGDDIRCIREMMITAKGGRLESLDMSDAFIVAGGGWYIGNAADWEVGDSVYVTKPNIISESMFEDCDAVQELVLPNSVVRISHYMFGFSFGSNIRKITIGRSTVGGIDGGDDDDVLGVLAWMDKLEEINVHADNPKFASVDGIMYDKDKTILYHVPPKCKQSISFPSSLTTIAGYAFRGYAASSIKLPNSVKELEDGAFADCEINAIDMGTVSEIGNGVFLGCKKTESIILSESMTWIPDNTFRDCDLLSTITFPKSIRLIGKYVFNGCYNLNRIYMEGSTPPSPTSDVTSTRDVFTFVSYENIKLYVPKGSKSKYASTIPWSGLNIIEM